MNLIELWNKLIPRLDINHRKQELETLSAKRRRLAQEEARLLRDLGEEISYCRPRKRGNSAGPPESKRA